MVRQVRENSPLRSDKSAPGALNAAAGSGMITRTQPSRRAIATALRPAAPPLTSAAGPGIDPLVGCDLLDRARHPLGHQPQHGGGALLEPKAERPGDMRSQRPLNHLDVEAHRPAEEVAGIDIAQDEAASVTVGCIPPRP